MVVSKSQPESADALGLLGHRDAFLLWVYKCMQNCKELCMIHILIHLGISVRYFCATDFINSLSDNCFTLNIGSCIFKGLGSAFPKHLLCLFRFCWGILKCPFKNSFTFMFCCREWSCAYVSVLTLVWTKDVRSGPQAQEILLQHRVGEFCGSGSSPTWNQTFPGFSPRFFDKSNPWSSVAWEGGGMMSIWGGRGKAKLLSRSPGSHGFKVTVSPQPDGPVEGTAAALWVTALENSPYLSLNSFWLSGCVDLRCFILLSQLKWDVKIAWFLAETE